MFQRLFRAVIRLVMKVYFDRILVRGRENVPAEGGVLIAPVHLNGIVDPAMVMTTIRREVSFTAKSTLATVPVVGWLMKALRVIPLHRRQDAAAGSADMARNADSLAACRRALSEGRVLCLFPEGVSHPDPGLHPLRTGAARVAIEAALDPAGAPVRIVPAGMVFERRDRFRTGACIRYGAPIDVRAWLRENGPEDPRALTAAIERGIAAELRLSYGENLEEVRAEWSAARRRGRARMAARLLPIRRALGLILGAPAALWGVAGHLPALVALWMIAGRLDPSLDQHATNRITPGLVVFPAFWALALSAGALAAPWWPWGMILAAALPVSGYFYATRWRGWVRSAIRNGRR